MFFTTDPKTRLGYIVAIRHGVGELIRLTLQVRLHLVLHHFHGGVVQRHVVEQQRRDNALIGFILRVSQAHHRRLTDVESVMTRVEALAQLRHGIAGRRIEVDGLKVQLRLAPDHLGRGFQTLPHHAGAENIVAIDHHLQRLNERIEAFLVFKGELRLQHVRVALLGGQMVIEDAFLQRRQRINILHVARAARDGRDDAVDGVLSQSGEGQQVRGDVRAVQRNQILGNADFFTATHGSGECRQCRLAEQNAYISAQFGLTHAFDQRHRQQRMAAEFEEVIVPTHAFHLEHISPQACEDFLDFALWRFVLATGISVCVRNRQRAAVELAVGGQRETFQHHEGTWHHVLGQ
ncbi:hypothetical protein FX983_06540 [Pseudomonas frederiksbergensis]|uniref:Uncharacterized protein n=1 Tax=Pseudomonas frederiksbergensis TaxID=104087 RepID=A0A6L5BKT8_9PSED|nr:hypothetical protein FX983_06540 [Pseudomonas frederiksbergensis]